MIRTLMVASCAILIGIAASGCMKKYSHTLVGSIDRMAAMKAPNYDSGMDVQYIVFSEPAGARELMGDTCPVQMAQVDYRAMYARFRGILVSYPRVEVTRYCVKGSP